MNQSYKKVKLGDVVEVAQGLAINSKTSHLIVKHSKYPLLRIKDLLEHNEEIYIDGERCPKQCIAQIGDIIFSRTGQVGEVFMDRAGVIHNNCFKVTPNLELVEPTYLYYVLTKPSTKRYFNQVAGGSVQKDLGHVAFKSLEISLPPLSEQKRISSILSSFDNKIEQLKKENNILEDIAQSIFKEWFIKYNFPNKDGKPYKDNNGKMINSELGLIPEGWRVGRLGELVSNFISGDYGKEIPDNIYNTESICIRGTDLQEVLYGNPEKAPRRFLKKKSITEKLLQPGDLIIEISGGTEGQSTGRACYINQEFLDRFNLPMTCVNFCKIVRPKRGFTYPLYSYIQYFYNKGLFFNYENGSTGIKNLSLEAVFEDIPMALPPLDLLTNFEIEISAVYKKIQKNNAKSSSLKNIKDNLLKSLIK